MRSWWLLAVVGCGRIGFSPAADRVGGDDAAGVGDGSAPSLDDTVTGAQDANLVFVTSSEYVPGMLGSLANADAICSMHAANAGIAGTFVAWLSSSTVDAKARLGNARGWVRRDRLPFADTVDDLVAGRIHYPVLLDENGATYPANQIMATGSNPDGTVAVGYTCTDYTNPTIARRLYGGLADAATMGWTGNQFVACNVPFRLYCFQTDLNIALTPPAGTSRKAFEGSAVWPSSSGLAAADAMCASDAAAAGLSGTFVALLATNGKAAADRLPIGEPWSRVDGAVITADFTTQLAAVDLTASGTYLDDVYAWLGAATALDRGTATSTCADWSSTGSNDSGHIGSTGRSDGIFGSNTICNTGGTRVLCFQQ